MTIIDKAITQIDRWLSASEISEGRLGLLSSANAGAIQRIRNGTAQIATLQSVLRYIEQNPARK
jgi:hypothetical protein